MSRKYSVASLAIFLMLGVMLAGCVPKKSREKPAFKRGPQAVIEAVAEEEQEKIFGGNILRLLEW